MDTSSLLTNPRQVRLTECRLFSLISAGSGLDLRPAVGAIDIYESIFDNTISGQLTLRETIGFPELLPLVGTEVIRITFEIDYLVGFAGETRQSFSLVFRVRRLANQTYLRHEVREYTLELVTPEFVNSLATRITEPYKGTLDSAITEVISKHLSLDVKKRTLFRQECFGDIDVVLPNYTPLQAINFFSLLALSKDKQESGFLFFETLDQFYFVNLEYLFQQPVVTSFEVNANALLSEINPDQEKAFNTIYKLHQDHTFDIGEDIASGMLNSKTISLDILSRYWEETTSRYTEVFKKTSHADAHPVYPENFDQLVNPATRIFLIPTNTATATVSPLKTGGSSKESTVKELTLHRAVMLRNQQMKALTHLLTRLQVPGQPKIRAGAMIDIRYPSSRLLEPGDRGDLQTATPQSATPYHSGKHLVTSVHHHLRQKVANSMEYRMDLDVVRDSLRTRLPELKEDPNKTDRTEQYPKVTT